MDETHVVTCFLRNRGEFLLLRRSEEVGSYPGQWGGVAGHAEGDPDAAAREEIAEETGLLDACEQVRAGDPFSFEDAELETRWVVHPYLFDCRSRDAETDWETAEAEWVHPTEILRRETVPRLWTSYRRIAPSVESIRGDAEHGSAYLSVRALEVLRDRAGEMVHERKPGENRWRELPDLADKLLDARPSMAALGNRVNRAMAEAADGFDSTRPKTPKAVERAARDGIERAVRADERAAENATDEIRGATVLTLSRSGTVLDALPAAERVFVAESRPAREGVRVAEELAAGESDPKDPPAEEPAEELDEDGPDVTLHTDAATAHVLGCEDVDAVVVGADAVLPDGRVVNKTGTRAAALAAAREGVDCYAVAASDKVRTDDEVHLEEGDPEAVYDGEGDRDEGGCGESDHDESPCGESAVAALNPTFDVTPADLVSGVITERGVLDAEDVAEVAEELRELSEWQE